MGGPTWSGASQRLPGRGWSHTVLSRCSISKWPWWICTFHQEVYTASLQCAFLHAISVQTSLVSEFRMSNICMVSSSSELSSLAPPKKMTSAELEWCRSWQLESTPKRSLSDSDSVELELLSVDALESEVCDLDRGLDSLARRCGDGIC